MELKLLKINSAEKSALGKVTKNGAPSEKNSEYVPDIETFSKGLFTPVFGSKRLCIWLTFNLIQNYNPPPTKLSGSAPVYYVWSNVTLFSNLPLQNAGCSSKFRMRKIFSELIQ